MPPSRLPFGGKSFFGCCVYIYKFERDRPMFRFRNADNKRNGKQNWEGRFSCVATYLSKSLV